MTEQEAKFKCWVTQEVGGPSASPGGALDSKSSYACLAQRRVSGAHMLIPTFPRLYIFTRLTTGGGVYHLVVDS